MFTHRPSFHRRLCAPTRPLLIAMLLSAASPAQAQSRPADLVTATLEDLMNIEVTSASRKEQKAATTAAAIYVITQDDIRRSGMTTIPELLRLAPGVQVSQINANKWAISIHGFNDLYANKLLVLVDGRSVYNRSFSGVWWENMDMPIGDIEQIEVISGPGGAIWGANAVNGIINIITKTATDTHGAAVNVGVATYEGTQFSGRYSGVLGGVNYRVYSQGSDYQSSVGGAQVSANDDWRSFTNGVRLDWSRDANAVTVSSSMTNGRDHSLWLTLDSPTPNLPPSTLGTTELANGTVSATWTHTRANGALLSVQSYFDSDRRTDLGAASLERTADVSLIYRSKLGPRHDVVTGAGYRAIDSSQDPSFSYSLYPTTSKDRVLNLFAQDEIAVSQRVRLTLGAKVEHDSESNWGVQPTVRAIWDVVPGRQYVWGAYSRALRTPSLADLSMRVNYAAFSTGRGLPVVLGLIGNPSYGDEQLLMTEVGYRLLASSTLSVDVTAFQGRYSGLTTIEPLAPVVELTPLPAHVFIGTQFQNLLAVNTRGADIAAHWTPVAAWRIDASYSGLRTMPRPDPRSLDATAARFDGNTPSHQWQMHSTTRLGPRAEVTAALYHAGALRELGVSSYTRADLRCEIKATTTLSIVGVGQNLQSPAHAEFMTGDTGLAATTVPRSASLQLVWRLK